MAKRKTPAVFFDRDGTLIKQVELLHKPSEVKLFPGAAKAVRDLNKLGYLAVIITNQPVVARGIIGPKELDHIHAVLIKRFAKAGAKIDAIYYCPHHPQANVKKYRMICKCRKPNPGMIFQAAKEHGIDLKESFFVGDSTKDVLAANRAKVRMILVATGHGGKDPWQHEGKADFKAKNLRAAVRIIKKVL
jgi:D,D-heptose 1,7-bisphosphate phosphatase